MYIHMRDCDSIVFVIFQLVILANEKTSLLELWEERRILYEQCMDLQLFYRDTEQADAWMSKQEVRAKSKCLLQVSYMG